MSQTIRVRDEDAELIEGICHETGLSRPEAAHFALRTEAGQFKRRGQILAKRGFDTYISRLHPEVDPEEEIPRELRIRESLDSAEQLMAISPDVSEPDE